MSRYCLLGAGILLPFSYAIGTFGNSPKELNMEEAQVALVSRIRSAPDKFGIYGMPDRIKLLEVAKAEPGSLPGEFVLKAGERNGALRLSGIHIHLKSQRYYAVQYAPVGTDDGKVRYYAQDEWHGQFVVETGTNKWVASIPKWIRMENPPKS